MKLTLFLLLLTALAAVAETEERLNQRFTVQPEGKLVVDVDFGSIELATHETDEVVVDSRRCKGSISFGARVEDGVGRGDSVEIGGETCMELIMFEVL